MRSEFAVVLVTFARKGVDVAFDVAGKLHADCVSLSLVHHRGQPLVADQRDLGIDNQRPLSRELDDHVRPLQSAVLAAQAQTAPLHDVVATFAETRGFENSLKHDLSPAAPKVRLST